MKRPSIILICLISLVLLPLHSLVAKQYTEEEVSEMIAGAPGEDMYPQAAAYVLLSQKSIQYNSDFSAVTDEHLVVKILQDRGKNSYGDIKRRYNSDNDSMVVVKAVTHLADGTIQEVQKKAINDLTPPWLANASMYSNIMQKVISFPGIAPGVTIELKLRTYSQAPDEDDEIFIWGTSLFRGEDPISYKEISLTVPTGVNISHAIQNDDLDYNKTEAEDGVTYTWHVSNSLQIIPEPFMPSYIKISPRLIFTNIENWDEIASWFSEKFYDHVKTDGDIDKKAKELTKGVSSREDKIRDISLYVISDIRDVGEGTLPLGLAGYEPHDADSVLENKYGDWRDKAVLLVSLLEAAGIESHPVFVNRQEAKLAEDHPTLKQFSSIYVYVPDYEGEPLWVNPFADHCYFGFFPFGQGSKALLVRKDSHELLTAVETDADANLAHSTFEIRLKPNGDVEGSVASRLSGYFDWQSRSRLKDATPKKVEQFFLSSANAVGEGSLNVEYMTTDLANLLEPVKIAQTFTTPELGVVEGDMMIFRAPDVPFSFANAPVAFGEAMRFYDFELESELLLKTEGTIFLPDGYKAVYVAKPFAADNDYGSWSTEYKFDEQENTIEFATTIRLNDTTIDTDEYFEFKKAFDDFSKPKNKLILLEKM